MAEWIGGMIGVAIANAFQGNVVFLLPYAAGAMLPVVFWKMITDAINGAFSTSGPVGCAEGFALMTFLDTVL